MSFNPHGGSAFPRPKEFEYPHQPGMELRDYFAAHALQGMLAYSNNDTNGNVTNNCSVQNAACIAYQYADAMLMARHMKAGAE